MRQRRNTVNPRWLPWNVDTFVFLFAWKRHEPALQCIFWASKKNLEGWIQTQLHISSSLIARCGSQTGKSFSAQTCFCLFFGWLHEVTSYLTILFVSSLALLVLPFTIPADYVFLSRNVWNKKKKKPYNWSHTPINYWTHSNKSCSYILFDSVGVLG